MYLSKEGDLAAYEELRSGFTAAVSHELRTPLARLLTLLEIATLPGENTDELVGQAAAEVEQITELIDEVLFLSELESGARVVALGPTVVVPVLEEALEELSERASRAGVTLHVAGDPASSSPCARACSASSPATWRRTPSATRARRRRFTLGVEQGVDGAVVLTARDDGAGVEEAELPRLFERFYRADAARSSRGTGLGLAIVKHVVTQAGGTVEAHGGRGRGLEIRCSFP